MQEISSCASIWSNWFSLLNAKQSNGDVKPLQRFLLQIKSKNDITVSLGDVTSQNHLVFWHHSTGSAVVRYGSDHNCDLAKKSTQQFLNIANDAPCLIWNNSLYHSTYCSITSTKIFFLLTKWLECLCFYLLNLNGIRSPERAIKSFITDLWKSQIMGIYILGTLTDP